MVLNLRGQSQPISALLSQQKLTTSELRTENTAVNKERKNFFDLSKIRKKEDETS